jgi:hypothetical protein
MPVVPLPAYLCRQVVIKLVDGAGGLACLAVVDGGSWAVVDQRRIPRDRPEVPSIRELIRDALDAGRTVRQLADDSNGLVKFQTFQQLANQAPKEFPKQLKTITGMSLALNVPESTVVLAYAKGLGIKVTTGSAFELRLPPGVDHIDPSVQDAIINLTRTILRSSVDRGDGSERWPPNPEWQGGSGEEWGGEHVPRAGQG